MTIRVIETDKATSGGLRFATRTTPEPGYGDVLIDVTHTSLNFGETRRGARGLEADGTVLGWDASGVIVAVGPKDEHVKWWLLRGCFYLCQPLWWAAEGNARFGS